MQNTVNTTTHTTKTPTQLSEHPHIHLPTHYETLNQRQRNHRSKIELLMANRTESETDWSRKARMTKLKVQVPVHSRKHIGLVELRLHVSLTSTLV